MGGLHCGECVGQLAADVAMDAAAETAVQIREAATADRLRADEHQIRHRLPRKSREEQLAEREGKMIKFRDLSQEEQGKQLPSFIADLRLLENALTFQEGQKVIKTKDELENTLVKVTKRLEKWTKHRELMNKKDTLHELLNSDEEIAEQMPTINQLISEIRMQEGTLEIPTVLRITEDEEGKDTVDKIREQLIVRKQRLTGSGRRRLLSNNENAGMNNKSAASSMKKPKAYQTLAIVFMIIGFMQL